MQERNASWFAAANEKYWIPWALLSSRCEPAAVGRKPFKKLHIQPFSCGMQLCKLSHVHYVISAEKCAQFRTFRKEVYMVS